MEGTVDEELQNATISLAAHQSMLNDVDLIAVQFKKIKQNQAKLKEELAIKTEQMTQMKHSQSTAQFNDEHDRLARALRLVSKMKGIELKRINDKETMPENNKAVLKHFNDLSK